jgi:hypothetical protein
VRRKRGSNKEKENKERESKGIKKEIKVERKRQR